MANILFDLYGTLIDIHTDEEKGSFWKAFSKRTFEYHPYKKEELKRKYFDYCIKLSNEVDEIDILEVFRELFHQDLDTTKLIASEFRRLSTKYIRLYPGVKKLLSKLREDGHNIYLLSNAQESFTIPELNKFELVPYFDGIAISSMYGYKKPSSSFYYALISKYNLGISNTIMIGNDYECDYKAAKSLGLKAIYIHSNLTPKDQPKLGLQGFNWKKVYDEINNLLQKEVKK